MKRIKILSALTLAVLFAALTSCEKDEENEPQRAGSAQVSGILTANLDETDFMSQPVPEGTGITFVIEGEDLVRNPDLEYEYEDVVVNGSVDADGMYSVSLPAIGRPMNATVIFDDFEYDATVITTDDEGFQQVVTERRTFSRGNSSVSIVSGRTLVKDYSYSDGVGTTIPTAMIRGVVEAQFTDNVGEPTSITLVDGGSDYSTGTQSDVNVTGGTGTGMTVNYSANFSGEVNGVFINTPGMDYTIGDILTIEDGNNDATAEVTNVSPYMVPVPEGVVLTFTVGSNSYTVVTNPQGEYMVRLPANQGVANIQGIDFETTSVYFESGEFVTGPKIYTFDNVGSQALEEGAIIELDLSYSRSN